MRKLAIVLLLLLLIARHGESAHGQNPPAFSPAAGTTFLLTYQDSNGPGTTVIAMQPPGAGSSNPVNSASLAFSAILTQNGTLYQGSGSLTPSGTQAFQMSFSLQAHGGDVYQYQGSLSASGSGWSGQGSFQSAQHPVVTGIWTTQGVYLQATPAPAFSTPQVVIGPIAIGLPPQGYGDFVLPKTQNAPSSEAIVNSFSDQPAAVADDGSTITIAAPAGFIVATDQKCASIGGQLNIVGCPVSKSLSFTTVTASTPPQTLPQTLSIPASSTATLVASTPGGPAVVVIQTGSDCCGQAAPVGVSWDGRTLTFTAPSGYVVQTAGVANCTLASGQPNPLTCPVTGVPASFVTAVAVRPSGIPPATPALPVSPVQIAAPASAHVGQSVAFTTSGTLPAGVAASYIWDFGDGSLASGQTVSHAYTSSGAYTVLLTIYESGPASGAGKGFAELYLETLVLVDVPLPSVSYAAGWNLVAGPPGTVFTGADGPLYTLSSPPFNLNGSCSTAYQAVSATLPTTPIQNRSAALAGYWAYFDQPATVTLPYTPGLQSEGFAFRWFSPANCFEMVGNPTDGPVTVQGADAVYVYDPVKGYQQTATLQPGQGAWTFTFTNTTVTLVSQTP